jgi:hypothetical protein
MTEVVMDMFSARDRSRAEAERKRFADDDQ